MRSLYFKIFMWFWLAMALVGTVVVISTVTLQNSEANLRFRSFVASGLTLSAQSAIEVYEERGRDGLATFLDRMEERNRLTAFLFDAEGRELSGRIVPDSGAVLVEQAASDGELAVEEFTDSRLVAVQVVSPEGVAYVMLAEMDWPFRGRGGGDRLGGSRGGRGQPGDRSAEAGRRFRNRGDDRSVGAADRSGGRGGDRGAGGRGGVRGGGNLATRPWFIVWMSAIDQPGELTLRLLAIFLTAGILCYGLARYLTAPVLRLRDATHQLAGGDLSVRVGPAVGKRRDELAELGRDFDIMAERIESLLTTQRQLLSDVSHELRSPLARLNVALALARQRSGDEAAGPLDRIEIEAERLNVLIGQVLGLARLESGAAAPEFAHVDLSRLVADIAVDAHFEAKGKKAAVTLAFSEPCSVQGNESLLRSAIENVVRNAVRYTDPGTDVEIGLAFADIADDSVVGGAASRCAIVSVRDHGPGVSDDHLAHLFEPFYRSADSRDRKSGGTGLGLSITERAVRLHGGTVDARNAADDGGLIVEIRLPVNYRP